MKEALRELKELVPVILHDKLRAWQEKWIVEMHSTAVITREALEYSKEIEDYKEYMKKNSYRQFGEALAPYIKYTEEFTPFGPWGSHKDLKMFFDVMVISNKPKE